MSNSNYDYILPGCMAIKAIILDGDGTSFDTERVWISKCALAANSFGVEITAEKLTAALESGQGAIKSTISPLLPPNTSYRDVYDLATQFMQRAKEELGQFPEKEGFLELVNAIGRASTRLALATSADKEWMHFAAGDRIGHFHITVCVDDVGSPKPDPAVYQETLRRLELKPEECIAVEDSPDGIRAANGANIPCYFIRDVTPVPNEVEMLAAATLPSRRSLIDLL